MFDHHPDQLAPPERHDHARAQRQWRCAAVIERPRQRDVQRNAHPDARRVGGRQGGIGGRRVAHT
ncbi:Uncharacterised protein [Bordetella pertussis]|nr:Uncharacterised protein [Bordetella pertussis]